MVLTDIVAFETADEGRDAYVGISEREDIYYVSKHDEKSLTKVRYSH